MQISFCFCKTCICLNILENIQISVNMLDRLDITDEYSVKCDFILNTVILWTQRLIFHWENFEHVMFYDLIYFAKGFRMRPKVWPTSSVSQFFLSLSAFLCVSFNFISNKFFSLYSFEFCLNFSSLLVWTAVMPRIWGGVTLTVTASVFLLCLKILCLSFQYRLWCLFSLPVSLLTGVRLPSSLPLISFFLLQ